MSEPIPIYYQGEGFESDGVTAWKRPAPYVPCQCEACRERRAWYEQRFAGEASSRDPAGMGR